MGKVMRHTLGASLNLRLNYFFFQAEDGIRDSSVTGVQTCALPISEAARAALDFGFDKLNLDQIVAYAAPANAASQKVMRKLGMIRDEVSDFDHPRVEEDRKSVV